MKRDIKVSYIYHSSFLIEFEHCYVLFDYFKGDIPKLDSLKPLYIFASHSHHDHFSGTIFDLSKDSSAIYILSSDIKKNNIPPQYIKQCLFVNPNEVLELKEANIKIETLKSTDQGVAFIIICDDAVIYHGGDLNWWHWEGESSGFNHNMETDFKQEIDKISGRHFDIAFLPLDPRQEEQFYLGFDYFMKHTDTDLAYPMHCWDDFSVINRLRAMDLANEYKNKVMNIKR